MAIGAVASQHSHFDVLSFRFRRDTPLGREVDVFLHASPWLPIPFPLPGDWRAAARLQQDWGLRYRDGRRDRPTPEDMPDLPNQP
jgi:hypothetical protein